MTAWIFAIRKGNEEHLAIALKEGFWDTRYNADVVNGDMVYFWQSGGGSFVAQCIATGNRRELGPADPSPWNDTVDYRWRFPLRLVSDQPVGAVTWTEVKRATGRSLSIQSGWCALREQDVELALTRFFADDDLSRAYRDDERRAELEALGYDLREFDVRAIARRQGQPAFRRELLRAYGERCAVTGSRTVEVLEAAHISPYRGVQTNLVTNGLLLRSDIHTLFDLQRLTVLPDLTVSVHPELRQGDYQQYHRRALAVRPADQNSTPDAELLSEHNRHCDWVINA